MNADSITIHQNNLRRLWQMAGPEKLHSEEFEHIRALAFDQWGTDWPRKIMEPICSPS